jgi:hypothetical protein
MQQKFELRSKLIDGLLAAGVLVLLEIVLALFIKPILIIFDRPGILVYTVALIAVTAICLERSLSNRDPEMTRAWWGILGGASAWVVIEFSNWLGNQPLINETGIIILMLALLISSVVWLKVAYVGLHYFLLLIFMGWVGHVGLASLIFLSSYLPQFQPVLLGTGILGGVAMAAAILYIFVRSQTRMDRLNAALVIWFSAMIMIYVFRGGLM